MEVGGREPRPRCARACARVCRLVGGAGEAGQDPRAKPAAQHLPITGRVWPPAGHCWWRGGWFLLPSVTLRASCRDPVSIPPSSLCPSHWPALVPSQQEGAGGTLGFWVKRTVGPGLILSCCLSQITFPSVLQTENSICKTLVWLSPTPKTSSCKNKAQRDLRKGSFPPGPNYLLPAKTTPHAAFYHPPPRPQWHPAGHQSDPDFKLPSVPEQSHRLGWGGSSLLLHPRSRAPASGFRVDKSPQLEGKWRGGGSAAAEWRRITRKTGTTQARWAKQKQKLSRKRRINSRHQGTSQAYAVQAGNTSTQ